MFDPAGMTYRYYPDESLDLPVGHPVQALPSMDLTSTARRLLRSIRDSGLPWDLNLGTAFDGHEVVDLRVHHLTGRWSITRWAWHRRRMTFSPHMSPARAHRLLPAAIDADRRQYQCPACQGWSRWRRGRTHEGLSPHCYLWWTTGRARPEARAAAGVILCPACDHAALIPECRTR